VSLLQRYNVFSESNVSKLIVNLVFRVTILNLNSSIDLPVKTHYIGVEWLVFGLTNQYGTEFSGLSVCSCLVEFICQNLMLPAEERLVYIFGGWNKLVKFEGRKYG